MSRQLVIACVLWLVAGVAAARPHERQLIGSEQDHSHAAADDGDCSSFYRTTFTSFRAQVHDRELRELDLAGVERIKVAAAPEGGVSIRGWNKPHARLVVCRYAVADTKAHAARVFGSIKVDSRDGEVTAYGPRIDSTQAWWVNITLYVPRRASVDVRSANGGVAIRNMSGRVTAHATTGGISVAQSSGTYRITTDTGGITLDRVSGAVEAASQGGGIAFKVAGAALPSIEARTAEGGHILCTMKGCDEALASTGGSRLRLGERAPEVRLSSIGGSIWIGPVTY